MFEIVEGICNVYAIKYLLLHTLPPNWKSTPKHILVSTKLSIPNRFGIDQAVDTKKIWSALDYHPPLPKVKHFCAHQANSLARRYVHKTAYLRAKALSPSAPNNYNIIYSTITIANMCIKTHALSPSSPNK